MVAHRAVLAGAMSRPRSQSATAPQPGLGEALEALRRIAQPHGSDSDEWAVEVMPVPADPMRRQGLALIGQTLACILGYAATAKPLPWSLVNQLGPSLQLVLAPPPPAGLRLFVSDRSCVVVGPYVGDVAGAPAYLALLSIACSAPGDVNRALWALIAAATSWPTDRGDCGASVGVAVFTPTTVAEA